MSSEELQELHEHAQHAKHDPTVAPVSVTMAVLAVLVAVVSLLGHRAHTEEVLLQNKASDQWAYYQAKNIRRHNDELFADLTAVTLAKDADQISHYEKSIHRKPSATETSKRRSRRRPGNWNQRCKVKGVEPIAMIWARFSSK